MTRKYLGDKLEIARKRTKKSQSGLSDCIKNFRGVDLSQETISEIERGKPKPRIDLTNLDNGLQLFRAYLETLIGLDGFENTEEVNETIKYYNEATKYYNEATKYYNEATKYYNEINKATHKPNNIFSDYTDKEIQEIKSEYIANTKPEISASSPENNIRNELINAVDRYINSFTIIPYHPKVPMALASTDEGIDSNIGEYFEDSGRKLFILGMAGSGKTYLLIALARYLLEKAKKDKNAPIPIIIDLASYIKSNDEIKDGWEPWLIYRLNREYGISSEIAKQNIQKNFLFLFNGLDEVHLDHRISCIQAISDFWNASNIKFGIAVTCRTKEYENLKKEVEINEIVEIKLNPLSSDKEIIDYIQKFDGITKEFRKEFSKKVDEDDKVFLELIQNPLFLNMIIDTFNQINGMPIIVKSESHLVEQFVTQKSKKGDVDSNLTTYLRFLAETVEGTFYIEELRSAWMPKNLRVIYEYAMLPLIILNGLLFGILGGLGWGIFGGVFLGQDYQTIIICASIGGTLLAILGCIITQENMKNTYIADKLTFSFKIPKDNFFRHFAISQLFAMSLFSIFGIYGYDFGIIGGISGFIIGMFGTISRRPVEIRSEPNQGVYNSLHTALQAGLIFWVGYISIYIGCIFTSNSSFNQTWVIAGIVAGMILSFHLGGQFVIQHFLIRFLLNREGLIPKNYASFLKHASNKHLMRDFGAGFAFRHPIIQEYFKQIGKLLPHPTAPVQTVQKNSAQSHTEK